MSGQYVVDTSVLIQGFIGDTQTAHARGLLREAMQPINPSTLNIPEFCLVECANVLWKRTRFFQVSAEIAKTTLANIINFPIIVHTSAIVMPRALEIGLSQGLAVYDCVHIALAEKLNCPLITVDVKQANAARASGVTLKPITDFPEYSSDQN